MFVACASLKDWLALVLCMWIFSAGVRRIFDRAFLCYSL